jgi:replication initiation and membrane attachment protein DnaB
VLISVKDTRIQSAELGDFHYRKFLIWAFANRQTKGAFLANIAKARVSVQENDMERSEALMHYANLYEMSPLQLEQLITQADQNGVSVVVLHDRLAKGLRGDQATKRGDRKKSNLAKDDENE